MTDITTGTATQTAASALLASNRRRRRVRLWITIGTLPLTLAALLLVGKLLSMYAFAHQSISAYVVDDYAGSQEAARGQHFLNWFERYKAPYNLGTALAGGEELPQAAGELQEALQLAQGLEVCPVRINLSLVFERMGDVQRDAGNGAGAADLYGEALTVTVETPEECHSEEAQEQSPDPDRDMSETLEEMKKRQQQKQQEQQQPEEQEEPEQPEEQEEPEPQPSEEKLEELQDKLDLGTQERDQQQGDDEPGGSGTDKPW